VLIRRVKKALLEGRFVDAVHLHEQLVEGQ